MSDEHNGSVVTHKLPTLMSLLIGLQNEAMYVIECIAGDFTGEAKSSLNDVLRYLDEHELPSYIDGPVREAHEEATSALLGSRDVKRAVTIIQRIRRRIANEIAMRTGETAPYARERQMITTEQAQAFMESTLRTATSMTTYSGVCCDYNTFYLDPDDTASVIAIQHDEVAESITIACDGIWRSRRETFCGDGDRFESLDVDDVRFTILLSAQPFSLPDKDVVQSHFVYTGDASKQNGHITWQVIKGLYESSSDSSARVAGIDNRLQMLLTRMPYVLWRVH